MSVPLLALLTDPDDKVRALAALLIGFARQCGGVLYIRKDLIDSAHVGHVLEYDVTSSPDVVSCRIVTLPPDMVQGLAYATRVIAADVGDTEHADPECEAFLRIPRDTIRGIDG